MSSNLIRRSERKRQTRLTFDPVEPSSSATMSPARLRYQTSRGVKSFDISSPGYDEENDTFPHGKKYAVIIETPPRSEGSEARSNGRLPFKPITTPEPSSQTQSSPLKSKAHQVLVDSESDLEIVPTYRHRRLLDSGNKSSLLSPIPSDQADLSLVPAGEPTFSTRPKVKSRVQCDGADDSSEESDLREHQRRDRIFRRSTPHPKTVVYIQDGADTSSLHSPPRAKIVDGVAISPRKLKPLLPEEMLLEKSTSLIGRRFLAGGTSFNAPVSRPQSTKVKKAQKFANRKAEEEQISLSDDDDDDLSLPTPQPTQSSSAQKAVAAIDDDSDQSLLAAQRSARKRRPIVNIISDEDGSSDEMPEISKIQQSSLEGLGKQALRRASAVDTNEGEEGDDNDDKVAYSFSLKRRRPISPEMGGDDEDVRSKRRRGGTAAENDKEVAGRSRRSSRTMAAETKRQTRAQQQKKPHRTVREKKMELLKRRAAGERIEAVTDSSSDDEVKPAVYDSDSDHQALSEFEDEERNTDDGIEEVRRSIQAPNRDQYDDDFVVDDDDEPLGVPSDSMYEIPLQFTQQAHRPLKEHFKDVVEWMVQNKINPGFRSQDDIYTQAFRKLNDEVLGYANSKFSSAAWSESFTRALWARPIYYEAGIPPGSENEGKKCEACGRSNHPAKFEIQFRGAAYVNATLEEIDQSFSSSDDDEGEDKDEEDDDDEDKEEDDDKDEDGDEAEDKDEDEDINERFSVNSKGQDIPSTSTSWFVGRFCKANAEIAHSLIHWKFALNEWVLTHLESEGHLAPAELQRRVRWTKSKLGRFANNIVDSWEKGGQIKDLYQNFKANLEAARTRKPGRWEKSRD